MENSFQETDESPRQRPFDSADHYAGSAGSSACAAGPATDHPVLARRLVTGLTSRHILTFLTIVLLGGCLTAAYKRGVEYVYVPPFYDSFRFHWMDAVIYQLIVLCAAYLVAPLRQFVPAVRVGRRVFLVGIFLVSVLLANLVSWLVLDHFPRDQDNVAKLFQARVFSELRLTVDEPKHPEFFHHYAMVSRDGKYFSKYPRA